MDETISVDSLSSDGSQGGKKRNASPRMENQSQAKKMKTSSSKDKKKVELNKPSGTRSMVWEHFDKFVTENGKNKAKCKYCKKDLCADSSSNGTSALKRHLKSCKEHPDKKKDQTNLFFKQSEDVEGEASVRTWKFCNDEGRTTIVEMIIIDEMPFSTVEKEGFRRLIQTICPNLKIPSRKTVSRDVARMYVEEKITLKSGLTHSKPRVSLTTDTWTSIQQINYMCVTAHYIDDNWRYQKRIINFKPISSHKGEEIGRVLLQCLKEWDIDNVLTITTDNASSNDTAIAFLKTKLNNLFFDGRYLHTRCMAHILNLIVKDGLTERSGAVERIRNAIRYIRQSPGRIENFKKCVKAEKIDTKSLLSLDINTRWNSTFEMLSTAEKFEKAFEAYDLMDQNFKHELESVPTSTDWHYVRDLSIVLELFQRKTTRASASSQVVVNLFFNDIMDVDKHLRKMKASKDLQTLKMGCLMQAKFEKYWRDDKKINNLLYFAAILDPRLKTDVIHFGFERIYNADKTKNDTPTTIKAKVEATVKRITDELGSLFRIYQLDYELENPNDVSEGEKNFDNSYEGEDDSFIEFKSKGACSSKVSRSELQKYLDDKVEDHYKGFSILDWWKTSSSKFPILAKMAKDILAIPVSSVASEQAFSTGGRVVESHRSSLSTPLVESLICTQDWIRRTRKKINEDITDYDDIGKEICDMLEPVQEID